MRVQLVGHVRTPPSFSSPVAISVFLLPSIFACRWCRVALPHGLFVPATLLPCAGRVSASARSHLYRHIFSLPRSLSLSLSRALSRSLWRFSTIQFSLVHALFQALIRVHSNKVSPVCVWRAIMSN